MNSVAQDLTARWESTCQRAGLRDTTAAGRRILDAYAEEQRRYHTQEHLLDVLRGLGSLAGTAAVEADRRGWRLCVEEVELAAFFHDVVYDPRSGGNEELSAMAAADRLALLGASQSTIHLVGRLVRLTASHDPSPDDVNGRWLCDADLLVLARPWPQYVRYTEQVRAEYAHVPDDGFAAGRASVLRSLVDGGPLFTLAGPEAEARAQANLARELEALDAGNPARSHS